MSLTPDGTKNNPVHPSTIDECWIQPTMFPNLVKYSTDITKSPYLDDTIITACSMIDDMCNRYFLKQTIDEIFPNTILSHDRYNTFILKNIPLIEVDKVWVQIVSTFAEVSNTYLQVMEEEAIVKILPTYSTTASVPYPFYLDNTATNIWIRYESGFDVDYSGTSTTNEVPYNVRMATSLLVDYLFASFDVQSGIDSFSTQTYSQKNSSAKNDAVLSRVSDLIKNYKLSNVR